MRHVALLVLLLLVAANTAVAQTPDVPIWYPYQNTVKMSVDIPQDGAWTSSESGLVAIHGWAWNCNGQGVDLRVWRADAYSQSFVQVPGVSVEHSNRPDVQAAFSGTPCHVPPNSGFVLRAPLEPGTYQIIVQGYSPGGLWHPVTGLFIPATATRLVHTVVVAPR